MSGFPLLLNDVSLTRAGMGGEVRKDAAEIVGGEPGQQMVLRRPAPGGVES
jgi:hypothetical protein